MIFVVAAILLCFLAFLIIATRIIINDKLLKWCTYSYNSAEEPFKIGRIVDEGFRHLKIIYSEKRDPVLWDPIFVKRFFTLREAIDFYWSKGIGIGTKESFIECTKECFPSYREEL